MQTRITIERPVVDDPRWPAFVAKFPAANVFHSPEMARTFAASAGFEVFPAFATMDREVVALAVPVMVKILVPFATRFTNRLIMFASPLYRNDECGLAGVREILRSVEASSRHRCLFLEIRNSQKFPAGEMLPELERYEYIPYQNYLIDLSGGEEPIWNAIGGRTRNHVRKGEKKKAIVREIRPEELGITIDLIRNLYRRKHIPVFHKSVFENAYRFLSPSSQMRVIVFEVDGRIVGTRFSLNYAGTVYDWYAASDPLYNNLYPNEALAWETIRWGCAHGYRYFDFGGGAIRGQEYGPARFKEKFRGELVEFGRYRLASLRVLYRLAEKAYAMRIGQRKGEGSRPGGGLSDECA